MHLNLALTVTYNPQFSSPPWTITTAAALLLLVVKVLIKEPALYEAPVDKAPPPWWIRGLLILTCAGVSFAHGSNDGQKGMGLIMLILIGTLPSLYALDLSADAATLSQLSADYQAAMVYLDERASSGTFMIGTAASEQLTSFLHGGKADEKVFSALAGKTHQVGQKLDGKSNLNAISKADRRTLRSDIYLIEKAISKLDQKDTFKQTSERKTLVEYKKQLREITEFIPTWVKFAVVVALGLGTLIGWKRIVMTVGEKIGKDHLTYAQGVSAELIAMITIFAADHLSLPVSTTHILSSGIAGTMKANGSGIQKETVRNLLIAWILTLPACMFLSATIFSAGLFLLNLGVS